MAGAPSPILCHAITTSVQYGIAFVVSAGNSREDAVNWGPANCADVIAVSGYADYDGSTGRLGVTCVMDSAYNGNVLGDDAWWDFGEGNDGSNFGSLVDVAAPAVCYLTTEKGGGYDTFGGTSGAAPHVAGAYILFKWMTGYSGATSGQAVIQAMTEAGWTVPQNTPCGFIGDPDVYHEPVIWLAAGCDPLSILFADIDCSGAIDASDSQKILRYVVYLNYEQNEPCPDIGPLVKINGPQRMWGDVDCDGDVDAVDTQKISQYVGGQTPDQQPGCPAFASSVTVFANPHSDPDDDTDGVYDIDEAPCGGTLVDPALRPERIDGVFAGVDDDGDTQFDEALTGNVANFDCDGDGYKGGPEAGTPLCGNGINDDGLIYGGSDDAIVDDGCPGGPGQVGAYSEAQFKIGLTDQDPCGTNGWPSDLAGGDNRVSLQDVTSFTSPQPGKLNTSPGQPGFNSRWDLVPGLQSGSYWISLQDLTTLTTGTAGSPAYPPMLGGVKAYGGPPCPWPA